MNKISSNLNSIVIFDESTSNGSSTSTSGLSTSSGMILTASNNNNMIRSSTENVDNNGGSSMTNGSIIHSNIINNTSANSNKNTNKQTTAPELDCYGDFKEALSDYERFFNNSLCSDVSLLVGDEIFYAHKLVLVKHSEVFERMLSQQWNGEKKEIELVEDKVCAKVFPAFLRFLYCNHILCSQETALPLLILADKYNVPSLRKVCIDYAVNYIIPHLTLKDIFHVWFQYGTKCFHQVYDSTFFSKLPIRCHLNFYETGLKLSFVQQVLLDVQSLKIGCQATRPKTSFEQNQEYDLKEKQFPLMVPDELFQVERHQVVEQFPKIFSNLLLSAYKYQALPLTSRSGCREFSGSQFLLRNYTEVRWDKRICIPDFGGIPKFTEISEKILTKASATPAPQTWDWELKIHPKGYSGNENDFRVVLISNAILDQSRAVEYLLSIVDDKKIIRSVAGSKTFSKTRYNADFEMEKKVTVEEVVEENSPLLPKLSNDFNPMSACKKSTVYSRLQRLSTTRQAIIHFSVYLCDLRCIRLGMK
uniref:BTB domain-containing protein n=1 Tax=Romanomermis culicivorax TaxID=13658 RepID=A0A915IQU8_ROMCU